MRKWIAIMIMLFVTVNFYTSLKRKQPAAKSKKELPYVIEEIKDKIDGTYPENPIEVVEIHNNIINIIYGKELTEEQIVELTELQRKLYGEEFLALNPLDKQIESANEEILINTEKGLKIISSKVMNSYHDPPGTMRVQVVHYSNKYDIAREYILKKESHNESLEEQQWKIYGWKNMGSSKVQEEEEE